ncbi:hypothetical protein BCV69DRAFT_122409 [Microstroma glucosiphilum]|uniref:DUF1365-domain-containing protein n=1 Tax=Pseudomicrostroma glucosiphilum TaxID=1684307 RepID=A0A316TYK5_9BASI|nr:hypothetical protein BCV69DRAFT_122409 [Pseudomicrostroma glucosiphilum]PWN17794.1 hypothetical protein BCV69DRAFT_122409 [Pseudomicrostroma glucosiphilum]
MGAVDDLLPEGISPRGLDFALAVISLLASYILFLTNYSGAQEKSSSSAQTQEPPQVTAAEKALRPSGPQRGAYLLPSFIHHARMLPKDATHIFRYPTLYLAISLTSLEQGKSNTGWGGRLFRWNAGGKRGAAALTALEAADYLGAGDETSWLAKLETELTSRSFLHEGALTGAETHFEVWATTMPSLMGIHGINPLTVYYLYRKEQNGQEGKRDFYMCLLEVHNTFSERHLYILPAGVGEDEEEASPTPKPHQAESQPKGEGLSWQVNRRRTDYDHQWTFPRSFHVSPFNDRGGYYRLHLKSLWSEGSDLPTMDVRLLLLVPDESATTHGGQPVLHKKILATLESFSATSPRGPLPLTGSNLFFCLARQPFDLLLTFVRIVYQAAKLHYAKRLDVFGKPDMTVATAEGDALKKTVVVPEMKDYDGQGWPLPSNATQIERVSGVGKVGPQNSGADGDEDGDATMEVKVPKNGSIYWPAPTVIDEAAKERFHVLARASPSISVRLVGSDGSVEAMLSKEAAVAAEQNSDGDHHCDPFSGKQLPASPSSPLLTIYLMSPAFYSDLLLYPSADLALLLGSRVGRRWGVSHLELFRKWFSDLEEMARCEDTEGRKQVGEEEKQNQKRKRKRAEQLATVRRKHYKWAQGMALRASGGPGDSSLKSSQIVPSQLSPSSSSSSPLDLLSPTPTLKLLLVLYALHYTSVLSERVFWLLGARYEKGTEPWLEWMRGEELLRKEEGEENRSKKQEEDLKRVEEQPAVAVW